MGPLKISSAEVCLTSVIAEWQKEEENFKSHYATSEE